MYEGTYPSKRFAVTLDFLKQHISTDEAILDLGVVNPFSDIMKKEGYTVDNTSGEDLDTQLDGILQHPAPVLTAFEIFEHLLAPLHLLQASKANKLVASVPLKLWFASAYRSKTDPWDRHYHEFEDWQFDWLLEKAGWEIKSRKKFTHPVKKIGVRPLLRLFVPRYYLVYAERTT
ncbi:methyltransferase [Croceiramulus getboli]|nr:methyltransferase [Flavobacteriaceae bacterium YJPT1-3]